MKSVLPLLMIFFFSSNPAQGSMPDMVHHVVFDDFETGETFGWEAYPYLQDIGYDGMFFTLKSPTHKGSKYALARPVRANDAVELYQGFTKRLDIWTSPLSVLSVAVYLQSEKSPEKLELSLGTYDGRRFFHTLKFPETNKWLELEIPFYRFTEKNGRQLGSSEHIQVVTIRAEYDIVYPLFTYTILIDDFKLSGERPRRFTGVAPSTTDLELFSMSLFNRHFYTGENISISVRPEPGQRVTSVSGELIDSNGRKVADVRLFDNGTNGDEKAGDGIFTNSSIYRLTEKDARGQWELRLAGSTDSGRNVEHNINFIFPGRKITAKDHPRIYFSASELKELINSPKNPAQEKMLQSVMTQGESFLRRDVSEINQLDRGDVDMFYEASISRHPYARSRTGWSRTGPEITLSRIIEAGAMRYAFTGDTAAGLQAKEALLKLCSFSSWNHPWLESVRFWIYYMTGRNVVNGAALGYDLIHDLLSEEERKFVYTAILEKGIKPFYRDMVEMDRMPSHQTNHIAHMLSGIGFALVTLYGDDAENPALEPYLSGILEKSRAFIRTNYKPGGGAGEPYTYYGSAANYLSQFLYIIDKNFGIDMLSGTHLHEFYLYPLWASHSNGSLPDFGDSGRSWGWTSNASMYFTWKQRNPFLYNYIQPHWERGNGGLFGLLWYTEDIEPVSRTTLPTSRMFESNGIMVMRSCWNDEGNILVFRAGPNANHYHYDQGSFILYTNGEELLSDPRHGGYYTNQLFAPYNIQAIGHNTLIVDNDPESQAPADYCNGIAALRDWPKMIHHFTGEFADAAEAELACVYKNKLSGYTRAILSTKDGPIFLFDKVNSPENRQYSWIFHTAKLNEELPIAFSDNTVTIDRERSRLTMNIISPEVSARIRPTVGQNDGFIALSGRQNQREAVFFAVLSPEAKPSVGEYGPRPATTLIEARGWTGARIRNGDRTDMGMFRLDSRLSSNSVENFDTDADRFTATFDNGRLVKAYFEGSELSGHGLSIKASSKITAAAGLKGQELEVEVNSPEGTEIRISRPSRPSSVSIDGAAVRNWRYDSSAGILSLNIPKGRSDIRIR